MSIEFEARAEAEKRYPDDVMQLALGEVNLADQPRAAFIAGAEWQASRPVTDEQADAAQIAFHEYVFGPDEPLTARDIGVARQAWKVAIQAARTFAGKETP